MFRTWCITASKAQCAVQQNLVFIRRFANDDFQSANSEETGSGYNFKEKDMDARFNLAGKNMPGGTIYLPEKLVVATEKHLRGMHFYLYLCQYGKCTIFL